MRKKIFTFLLAIVASIGFMRAESGTCGDNLTWDLTDGVLTISGSGSMTDYNYSRSPWYSYRSSIATVIIGDEVTSIGNDAFYYCSGLTAITIPESVTSIGSDAFARCSGLTSVTIPKSVTSIGECAFDNCSHLRSVTISNGVTSIGKEAFDRCNSLKAVCISDLDAWCKINFVGSYSNPLYFAHNLYLNDTLITNLLIPNGVTSIGKYAFTQCNGLTSVTIPNSVTSIGESAFSGCSALNEVHTSDLAAWCKISFGNYNANPLEYAHNLYLNNILITDLVIPNGVTSIGKYAFYDCSSMTSVTIPNSVRSIGEDAFTHNNNEPSPVVVVPDPSYTNSISSIRSYAPNNRSELKAVYISDLAAWCNIIFGNNDANPLVCAHNLYLNGTLLTDLVIPNSVARIGNHTFSGCSSITSVTIPNSVNSIGTDAFYDCDNLTIVNISDLAAWCKISFGNYNANPLEYAHNLYLNGTLITDLVVPDDITTIGYRTFCGCSSFTSVTIPNTITSISESAFSGCSGLTLVIIPNSVTSIGSNAFWNVLNIAYNGNATGSPWGAKSVNGYVDGYLVYSDANKTDLIGCSVAAKGEIAIPNSVTNIGESAFYECSGLTSITIPNSVTNIGESAFSGCRGLTSVTIPNSVTSIGKSVFSYCRGLTSVTIPNSVTSIGNSTFYGCSGLTSVTIPNSITSIGNSAFSGCRGLTSVTIPESVTSIGSRTFYGCSSLTSVTIPNSVTSIGESVFSYCSGLTSVTIPNSVTSIGNSTFYGCSGLTSVTIPNSITSIGNSAFSGCSGLTSITIPNSVTNIGNSAFSGCGSLTSVTIPNSVTSIGNNAFYNVLNIAYKGAATGSPWGAKSVSGYVDGYLVYSDANKTDLIGCYTEIKGEVAIPYSVKSIGDYAFRDCTGLTSIIIPNSVTSIGYNAFYQCSGLNAVYISDLKAWCEISFVVNSSNPLYYAHNLYLNLELITDLVIPNDIKSISDHTFSGCSSLTSITIPNSVTSISYHAFSGCSSLTSVTIPNSVTSISKNAFSGCSGLTYIISNCKIPPTIEDSSFPNDVTIFVLNEALDNYQKAPNWKYYDIKGIVSSENVEAPTSAVLKLTHNLWVFDNNYITSCGIEGGEMIGGNTLEYIGLEPNSEYKDIPIVLTANTGETETVNVSFSTTALELTTKPSKPVSSTTAILLAETNMADAEVSCGFEYKRNDAPADMEGNKVYCPVASGQMAGRLKNLKDDVYYKYRAFYQSAAGNMYYGDWQYIFTGDVAVEFDPILYTYGATVVKENEATISGYALAGSEDFTEQGFEYWAESRVDVQGDNVQGTKVAPRRMPAALNEHFYVQASGISLRVTLNNLDAGTVYKYRVYGKVGDQYYYGAEQTFTTTGTYTPPTYTITFANWDGAVLQSSQVTENEMPEYVGATPTKPEDEQYIYTFNGWTPELVAATADATYTAQYQSEPKSQGIEDVQGDDVQCTKVLRDGVLYIERNGKVYTVTGAEVK